MAALQTSSLFPVVQTKEGSGLSIVPAESAGQSETAPGIENVVLSQDQTLYKWYLIAI